MAERWDRHRQEDNAMGDDTRSKLVAVGAEGLADVLLELASRHDDAADMLQRLLASPEENQTQFGDNLEHLASLADRGRFIDWRHSSQYAMEVADVLQDLEAAEPDPRTGVESVAAFFKEFERIIEACDDSSGHVSDVFRYDASDHFVSYAKCCENKEFLEETVFRLCSEDDYGLTDYVVGRAPEYLPRKSLVSLADRFKEAAQAESEERKRWPFLQPLETLAGHLGKPDLVEWCRRARSENLRAADHVDIADAHLKAGDAETALEWLQKGPPSNSFEGMRHESLLMVALEQTDDTEGATEIAWRRFRQYRTDDDLADLLRFVGEGERERVIDEAWGLIQDLPKLQISDIDFLVEHDRLEDAAAHVVARSGELDGRFYASLTPLAKTFEAAGQPLAASLVYRALLDSILARGYSKAYGHGVRYLAALDRLAESVSDWQGKATHDTYVAGVREKHGRKWSFWKRVNG